MTVLPDHRDPQWSATWNFLGAYLHQDLYLVHGSPWDAVRDYAGETSSADRARCAVELRQLLGRFDEDAQLSQAAHELGLSYYPTYDGYSSYRVWLTAVAQFLEDPEAHPGPPECDAPLPSSEGAGGRTSTFTDRDVAERAVAENVAANGGDIVAWIADPRLGPNRAFEHRHSATIGRLAPPEATAETIHDVDRSRVILRRSSETAEGWFLLLAYPVATDPTSPIAREIDRTGAVWDPLRTLLAGYLHQDFDVHGSAIGAVTAFVAEAAPDQVTGAAAALRRLLDGDEEYLAAATEWLGMDYFPLRDGRTYRSWLVEIVEHLGSGARTTGGGGR